MIILELYEPDELPNVFEASKPYAMGRAAVVAKRSSRPLPLIFKIAVDIQTAVDFLYSKFSPHLKAFFSINDANKWAGNYSGEQEEGVRHAIFFYMADLHTTPPEPLIPEIYDGVKDNREFDAEPIENKILNEEI